MIFSLKDKLENSGDVMHCLAAAFESSATDPTNYYFAIQGENSLGSFSGLVAVNTVMNALYPEKKIDWEQVPSDYLCALFIQQQSQIQLSFSTIPFQLKAEHICLGKPINVTYPRLKSDIGEIFIEDIQGQFQWSILPQNKIGVMSEFHLGSSSLSLSLLKSVLPGDILVIEKISLDLCLAQKKWMKYKWDGGNSVELNDLNSDEETQNEPGDDAQNTAENANEPIQSAPEENRLQEIGVIPITVSFVLATKTLLLNEIENLKAGQHIALPENAHQHIVLKMNGISLAEGELVKVGEQFAIEIQRSFSSKE